MGQQRSWEWPYQQLSVYLKGSGTLLCKSAVTPEIIPTLTVVAPFRMITRVPNCIYAMADFVALGGGIRCLPPPPTTVFFLCHF